MVQVQTLLSAPSQHDGGQARQAAPADLPIAPVCRRLCDQNRRRQGKRHLEQIQVDSSGPRARHTEAHPQTCAEIKTSRCLRAESSRNIHAIDATSARRRGGAGLSPLNSVSGAVHPTQWLIPTQLQTGSQPSKNSQYLVRLLRFPVHRIRCCQIDGAALAMVPEAGIRGIRCL